MQLGRAGNPPASQLCRYQAAVTSSKASVFWGGDPGACTCLWGGFNQPLHGTFVATSFWAGSAILILLVGSTWVLMDGVEATLFSLGQSQIHGLLATPKAIALSGIPPTDPGPKKPSHVSIAPVDEQSHKQRRSLAEENLQMSLKLELNINQQINTGRCQGCLHCKLFNSPRLFPHAEERPEALQLPMGSKASALCVLGPW